LSKAFFILQVCAISLQKQKEAEKINDDFSALIAALPQSLNQGRHGLDSPAFWFSQAQEIWKTETNKK
jgi:hypothetical protein